jgi:hypothetical protein
VTSVTGPAASCVAEGGNQLTAGGVVEIAAPELDAGAHLGYPLGQVLRKELIAGLNGPDLLLYKTLAEMPFHPEDMTRFRDDP